MSHTPSPYSKPFRPHQIEPSTLVEESERLAQIERFLASPGASTERHVRLVRRLLERRQALRLRAQPLPSAALPRLAFDAASLEITSRLRLPGYGQYLLSAQLFDGDVVVRDQAAYALVQLAFVDSVLAVLIDPSQALYAQMAPLIELQAWQLQLHALDVLLQSKEKSAPQKGVLSWRVHTAYEGLQFDAYVHRSKKNGGHSSGAPIALSKVRSEPLLLEPSDEAVLRLLADDNEVKDIAKLAAVLRALQNHPRIFLHKQLELLPLTILESVVELHIVERDGELHLEPRVTRLEPENGKAAIDSGFDCDEEAGIITFIDPTAEQKRVCDWLVRRPLKVPAGSAHELENRLSQMHVVMPVQVPEAWRGEAMAADSRPLLRLEKRGSQLDIQFLVRAIPGAPLQRAGRGPVEIIGTAAGVRRFARRVHAEEIQARAAILELLEVSFIEDEARAVVQGERAILQVLGRLRGRTDVVVEWQHDPLHVSSRITASSVKLAVKKRTDWFQIEGHVLIDEESVALSVILDALAHGDQVVKLSERRWLQLEGELRDQLTALSEVARHGVITPHATPLLDQLHEAGADLSLPKPWMQIRQRLRTLDGSTPDLPNDLLVELRPYQLEGFAWLCRLEAIGVGGVLADDMGLGKTVQALAMLQRRSKHGPALVVVPTSLSNNWLQEAARFAPQLRMFDFRYMEKDTKLGPNDVVVATYGLLLGAKDELSRTRFATLIIDEAQQIKNPDTLRAQAVFGLQADWKLALTGTPVENHLSDLWSVFRAVAPEYFGTWADFRARFAMPIERQNNLDRRRTLSRLLRPFVLRRTKARVLAELPPKTDIDLMVELSDEEKALYEQARLASIGKIRAAQRSQHKKDARFVALAALTSLRRLACHPRLYDQTSTLTSSKLQQTMALLSNLKHSQHRALVFSQFTSHLELVRVAVEAEGFSYCYLDGTTPPKERTARIAAFNQHQAELFLISLKAGGLGLNLTAADYVLHLDPWWNPAVEDQASARAHRLGQTRPVTAYRLIAAGTVEEQIVKLHRQKRDLAEALLGEETDIHNANLSPEQIIELLETRLI